MNFTSQSDAGMYSCVATNIVGNDSESRNVQVFGTCINKCIGNPFLKDKGCVGIEGVEYLVKGNEEYSLRYYQAIN